MKVKKTVDIDRDGINITGMYIAKLEAVHDKDSAAYKNCVELFARYLQEVADKAFQLGLEESE